MRIASMIHRLIVGTLAISMTMLTTSEPTYNITTKRSDDRVEVKHEDGKSVFIVRSPSGISDATIERTSEQWPDKVVIQLRLKGLESLKISAEKHKLEAAVSSQNATVRLWMDGQEDKLLDSKSPYWMEIRVLDNAGRPTQSIPLNDGYIEMQLSKELFNGNPKSFKLEWIDFYRN